MSDQQPPAIGGRVHSGSERLVDAVIHSLGLAGALLGGILLIAVYAPHGGAPAVAATAIYIAGLFAMFLCSAIYNRWRGSAASSLLQGFDHSAIFLMIAGSYTPFCVLLLPRAWSVTMTVLVWTIALTGIAMRLCLPRLFARLGVGFYLVLGWIGIAAAVPLSGAVGAPTMILLLSGGLVYTAGVVFHLWESLPFQNAIWHGFVLAGATLHYLAVLNGVAIAVALPVGA